MINTDDDVNYETAILYAVMGEVLRNCKTGIVASTAYLIAMQNGIFPQVQPLLHDVRPLINSINNMGDGFTKLSNDLFTELKKQQEEGSKTNET